jgi:tetratricopeptide (TPR) repeat protein
MARVRLVTTVTLLAALACPSHAAEPRWNRLRTDNFELYSSASPRSARDTIRMFEQVRGFFERALGGGPAKPLPVRLVAFGSPKEFEPYKINDYAIAFYGQTADRDYIVMSRSGSEIFPVAVHEYVHLLVRHAGLKLPPWLNEGIAELYSTLRPTGDKVLVGDLIPGRHRALLDDKWVPLGAILGAARESAYYNEKNKAGSLYNEGWALTHMLSFRAEYRPKFSELMRVIAGGKDSAEALTEVYGRPLDRIERDLQQYLRGTSFQGALFPAKLERKVEDAVSEPVGDFEAALMLSDLSKEPEREKALLRLAEQDAARPEPYRGLGELAWRRGKTEEAVELFAKAYARGDRDSKLLWDYGRLLERHNGGEAAKILTELLAKDPARLEVRLELAETQVRAGEAAAALQTLAPIRKVTPDLAARFFKIGVYAHLGNGDRPNAEGTAKRFQEVARTDAERAEAEMLLRQSAAGRRVQAPALVDDAPVDRPATELSETDKPTLRRAEPPPGTGQDVVPGAIPGRASIVGKFVELDCRAPQPRMVVETAAGRRVFLIEDAGKVAITAGADGPVDMVCGPQKTPVKVEISYDRPSANRVGIDGIVRTLAF